MREKEERKEGVSRKEWTHSKGTTRESIMLNLKKKGRRTALRRQGGKIKMVVKGVGKG